MRKRVIPEIYDVFWKKTAGTLQGEQGVGFKGRVDFFSRNETINYVPYSGVERFPWWK